MKTLADFKRKLAANKNKPIRLVLNTVALKPVLPEDRTIQKVQGTSFSMHSPSFGREIWMDFHKASDWTFTDTRATYTRAGSAQNDGPGVIVFEFPADTA